MNLLNYKHKRRYNDASKVMSFALMYCPLCKDSYHTKGALRTHLGREHDSFEFKIFLKKKNV